MAFEPDLPVDLLEKFETWAMREKIPRWSSLTVRIFRNFTLIKL